MSNRFLLVAAVLAATYVYAPPSNATELADGSIVVASRRVPIAPADFATPHGVERLYARLASTARSVCRFSAAPQTYSSQCADRALDAAVSDVGDAQLAALHRGRRPD